MALALQKDAADSLMQAFVSEYRPLIRPAKSGIEAFAAGGSADELGAARRLFHRIAGVSALVGWPELGTLAGMAEDVIALVHEGTIPSHPRVLGIVRRGMDALERVIEDQHEKLSAQPKPQAQVRPPETPTSAAVQAPATASPPPSVSAAPSVSTPPSVSVPASSPPKPSQVTAQSAAAGWSDRDISQRPSLRPAADVGDISDSRVMVVDDDPLSARLIELSLKKAGVKTQHCKDPREALAAIEAARPDLILLDVMMPGQDGFETCRQIRTQATVDQVPIIFITRVADVNEKVVALELGGDDYVTKPFEPTELLARVRTHILRHQAQKEQAFKDALTGAWNHRYFKQRIEQDLRRALSSGRPLCLAMMDVDKFKGVNDVHGHAAGDDVLAELVNRAHQTLRKPDIVARYGGDEMAVILPDTELADAERVMVRLNAAIKTDPIALRSGGSLNITISIGLTVAKADDTVETLAERADQALYVSKRNGRDRVSTS